MQGRRLPLEGVRVLELAAIVAGPFCGALMAEFGAEVLKTELPHRGDDLRRMGPSEGDCGFWWAVENRGKKVFTLDLHHPKAQQIVRQLVPLCDVVIENFRPGTLERWNLGWEELSRINPRLIMARVTTFGQTGPRSKEPGFAAIGAAFGGSWFLNGFPDRPPVQPRPVYPDYLTGLFTAFGILVALRHRDATGEGQYIDSALYESTFRTLEYTTTAYGKQGFIRERGGRQHVSWPGGACQTRDGHWVAFTAPAQHLFERLCAMLGHPELPHDARFMTTSSRIDHMGELFQMIEEWFASRTLAEASKELETHQVPYSPIMSIADIFADAHYQAREMIIEVPEPNIGPLAQPGVVPKLSRTPGRVTHAGPPMGTHTEEIFSSLLGFSPEEIAQLRAEGVI